MLKPCGTVAAFRRGCRCTACVKASSDYHTAYRERQGLLKLRASKLASYHKNKSKYKPKHDLWVSNNQTLVAAFRRNWRLKNRNKYIASRLARRRRSRNASGKATAEQITARMEYFGNACAYCGGPFEHVEHGIPLCRGGTNWPSNLRPSCAICNAKKGKKTVREFIDRTTVSS